MTHVLSLVQYVDARGHARRLVLAVLGDAGEPISVCPRASERKLAGIFFRGYGLRGGPPPPVGARIAPASGDNHGNNITQPARTLLPEDAADALLRSRWSRRCAARRSYSRWGCLIASYSIRSSLASRPAMCRAPINPPHSAQARTSAPVNSGSTDRRRIIGRSAPAAHRPASCPSASRRPGPASPSHPHPAARAGVRCVPWRAPARLPLPRRAQGSRSARG